MANVKIFFTLALLVSFLVVPAFAWWNSSRQPRYNVTLDHVNTSRRTTGIFWNFTALGVMATNCAKEIRLTNDTDGPSYDHPFVFTNGGGANRASKQEGYLSKTWEGFSHIGHETRPLPTKHLSTSEVLKFRGEAFYTYHRTPAYLDMIRKKFGEKARKHAEKMLDVKIKRRILGD